MINYVKNIFLLLFDRGAILLLNILIFVLAKNSYGLDSVGVWSIVANISQILSSIAFFNLNLIFIKDIIKDKNNFFKYICSLICVYLFGAVLYSLMFFLAIHIFYNDLVDSYLFMLIFLLSGFCLIVPRVTYSYFAAIVDVKYRAISITASFLCSLGYLLFARKFDFNLYFSMLIFSSAQFFICCLFLFKVAGGLKIDVDKIVFLKYVKYGGSLVISVIAVAIFAQADLIFVERYYGLVEVTYFSAALRITSAWFVAAGVLANAFYPKIIRLEGNEADQNFLLKWLIGIAINISFYAAIIFSFFSKEIIGLIYGDGMHDAAIVLVINMWAGIFIFIGAFSSQWLFAKGLLKIEVFKTVLAALLSLFMNLILTAKIGFFMPALISAFLYMIVNFFIFSCFSSSRPMFKIMASAFVYLFKPWDLFLKLKEVKCLFRL